MLIHYIIQGRSITSDRIRTLSCQTKHTVVNTSFPKLQFPLKKLKFHHWETNASAVLLEITSLLHSFPRKCLPNIQAWITIVCQVILTSKNRIPFKKQPPELTKTINYTCFSLTKQYASVCRSTSAHFPHHHTYQTGFRFNKIIYFSKDIHE